MDEKVQIAFGVWAGVSLLFQLLRTIANNAVLVFQVSIATSIKLDVWNVILTLSLKVQVTLLADFTIRFRKKI